MKTRNKRPAPPPIKLLLPLLLFLGLLTLALLLKTSLFDHTGGLSRAGTAENPASSARQSPASAASGKALPFVWSRTVYAGERIAADMFLALQSDDSEAEGGQAALLMSLGGSYVQGERKSGTRVQDSDVAEHSPYQTRADELAIWLPAHSGLVAEQPPFDNFRPGDYLGAYCPDTASTSPALKLIAEELEFLQVLAVDRSSATLCLALTRAQQLALAAHQQQRSLYLLPSAQFGETFSGAKAALPPGAPQAATVTAVASAQTASPSPSTPAATTISPATAAPSSPPATSAPATAPTTAAPVTAAPTQTSESSSAAPPEETATPDAGQGSG